MFRNARMYRLESDWPESEAAVSAELTKAGFSPCGPLTERSSGWVEIDQLMGDLFARRLNGADLLKLRSQSRVLPPAVINEALEERLEEYKQRMEESPPPREKRRLKAETRDELMPKALVKSDRILGYIDLADKLIVIDAGQNAAAERFIRHLRMPFGELNIRPLKFKEPIAGFLNQIFMGNGPIEFALGRECKMADATDLQSTVRWNDFDLSDKTIRNHVADGMRLTHLGIVYDNILSCVISEDGVISKIKMLGADDDDTGGENDPLARFDAEFVLLTGIMRAMLGDLKKQLGGFD
jgi:recombination associated protein RdgC